MKFDLYSTRYTPEFGIYTEELAVGTVYGNYRLTDSGVTDDKSGWWYFLRKYEDKERPYWYKKIRKPATDKNPEGEVVEEYVGITLPFSIPREWLIRLKRKAMEGSSSSN
jgi:hypothetical protein